MRAEVVAEGIPFGEGPVWCPDGTLVVTSVAAGCLYRVWPEHHRAEVLADTGGGANGAALASDGGFVVTQNGGIDLNLERVGFEPFDVPEPAPAPPSLQRVAPDGAVSVLVEGGLHAPNDLVVAADGTVFFTDPGHYPPPDPPIGRVMSWSPEAGLEVVADGFSFCNGIALDPDGLLVIVERRGLLRLHPDGSREWVVESLGGSDGFCLDAEGRFYAGATTDHGVRVVDPDGAVVEFLELEGRGITTNCCFGGPDGRTLFATDSVPGRVVAWEGLPSPGLPLHPWPAS